MKDCQDKNHHVLNQNVKWNQSLVIMNPEPEAEK